MTILGTGANNGKISLGMETDGTKLAWMIIMYVGEQGDLFLEKNLERVKKLLLPRPSRLKIAAFHQASRIGESRLVKLN